MKTKRTSARNHSTCQCTALIRDNQAIAVEDLAVKALGRTRLAKSVHDAGWASFVRMLEYKARLHGRAFHRIGRFVPASQPCSTCGVKDGPKPLHIREWQCQACGAWLDRDINAAVNVAKAAGLAVIACRARVRPEPVPAQRVEAGTHPKSRPDAVTGENLRLQGGVEFNPPVGPHAGRRPCAPRPKRPR
jgi:putative transposase